MRHRLVLFVGLLLAAMTVSVDAAEWGLIRPGVSTTATVRAKYGAPTRVDRQKVDNYDTENWVYVVFAGVGSWIGAFISLTFQHRKPRGGAPMGASPE